jgi:membrane protein YqaA with SNARE-associated domain
MNEKDLKSREERRKRKFGKKVNRYHHFYRRKGVYPFLLKNTVRLILGLGILVVVLYFLQDLFPNMEKSFEMMTGRFRPITILIIFLLSESLLGLITPDFFIIWAKQFNNTYAMVALLATLSYGGGAISYIIGNYIGHLPKVEKWLINKFVDHIKQIRTWGGVLIVFAALFPLPFSPVCMAAGMIRFPLPAFFLLGLFRFARFFGYALILYKVV